VSLANSFPELALQLFDYGRARDSVNGVPLQDRISRINAAISGSHGVAGVKAAMTLAGFQGGIPRRPLLPLGSGQVQALKALLTAEGLVQ
jgi:dihydrodipicolinate synthase/N-acetylneuraminate lyase